MRETDFLNNVKPDGAMVFRTSLPLGSGVLWDFKPAADGQMGRIISLYRDWQISGDMAWLKKLWPQAKKALDYAWTQWDADRDGLMEGEQHNTYDIEFYGPNSMMGAFYLGALKAGAAMAAAVGDAVAAKAYLAMYREGPGGLRRRPLERRVLRPEIRPGHGEEIPVRRGLPLRHAPRPVAGHGLGPRPLPSRRPHPVVAPGRSIKYNFLTDFRNFSNVQRTYALNDEKGLLLCSWPKGGRPPLPFPYSDEVWTGIEYQVASHLIYEGLLEEGLSVVKAVRDRYDGFRRNPWNEVECGHHYARAMSSWGVLLALSRLLLFGPGDEDGLRPEDERRGFPDGLDGRLGLGHLLPEGGGGERAWPSRSKPGAARSTSRSSTSPSRPRPPGRRVRSVKTLQAGSPAAASVRKEGDTIRVILTEARPGRAGQAAGSDGRLLTKSVWRIGLGGERRRRKKTLDDTSAACILASSYRPGPAAGLRPEEPRRAAAPRAISSSSAAASATRR